MGNKEEISSIFLRQLNFAVKGMKLYPAGHPSISHSISEAFRSVSSVLEEENRMMVGLVEGLLVIDEDPVYTSAESLHELLSRFRVLNIGTIILTRGVTEREIGGGLLRLLNSERADIEMQGGFAGYLDALGVAHITVLGPKTDEKKDDSNTAGKVYRNAIEAVQEAMQEVRLGRIPSSREIKSVISDMVDQVLENRAAILGLSMIKSYDEYTFHHCVNVSILSLALAEAVGMPREVLDAVGTGAILHDIGKIETYEGIIKKPGPLTDNEWTEVRKHPAKGADILRKMEGISELSIQVVLEHHLKYNGEGYPDVAGAKTQCEPAMCVSIADSYDALTTLRPYRMPFHPGKALETMRSLSGKDFEPHLLERFDEVLGIYPPGTMVRLNTNEIAVVKAPNSKDPTCPFVRIVFDRMGRKAERQELLLTETDEKGWRRSIVGVVDPLARNIDPSEYMW